jgi:hypothetical protein
MSGLRCGVADVSGLRCGVADVFSLLVQPVGPTFKGQQLFERLTSEDGTDRL